MSDSQAFGFESIGRSGGTDENLLFSGDRIYDIMDAVDEAEAITKALEIVNTDLGGYVLHGSPINRISFDESDAPDTYRVRVSFAPFAYKPPQTSDDAPRWEFEFGTETRTRRTSLSTTAYGTNPPNFNGSMGLKDNGDGTISVQGGDFMGGTFTFGRRVIVQSSLIETLKATISSVYLHTNNATFEGFPAGEVLFLGATGSQRGAFDYEVNFRFAQRGNRTGMVFGSITGVAATGWQEVEVFYRDYPDLSADSWAAEPRAVYVHTNYLSGNLSVLY